MFSDVIVNRLNLNKVYGEFGVMFESCVMKTMLFLDFGWAFIDQPGSFTGRGLGGQVGVAFDFYATHWLSVGASAAFDAQGYRPQDTYLSAIGGSFLFRLGFHI